MFLWPNICKYFTNDLPPTSSPCRLIYPEIILLQWHHNDRYGVSNHQPHDCLLNCLCMSRSKKHRSPASLAFVLGIHRWPANFPHKGPVTRKMFPFDDVIMSHHHHRGHNHRRTVAIFFHNFPITTTVTIRIEEKHYCYYHIHRCLELLS